MAPPPRRHRLLWLLGAAALVVLFAQTWTRAHRPGGIDLTTYLEAARAIQRGENPYALPLAFPYVYPPFFAFALIPLAHVPADLALILWFAASAAAIVWACREGLTLAYQELRGRPLTPFLAALFAITYPVAQSNLRNAQVNFFIVALAIAALRARATPARGLSWALATVIKIVPGVLAPYYVRRREWGVCAMAAVAALALCLAPALTLGARVLSLHREYAAAFVAGGFAGLEQPLDFSLGGMLAWAAGADGRWLRLIGAALPVAIAWLADRRSGRTGRGDALAFALYFAVIPLASPKSEMHHLAFALPAAALAFGAWSFGIEKRRPFPALLVVAAASYVAALVLRPWTGPLLFVSLCALAAAVHFLGSSNPQILKSSNPQIH